MRQLLRELKRRNVYQVAVTYLVAAFVVVQLADLAAGAFDFPGWFEPMIWVVAGLGFPITLVVAWAFELTPEGVRRTTETDPAQVAAEADLMSPEQDRARSRLAMKALVGLGLVGAAVVGGWYLMGGGGESPEISDNTVAVLPFDNLSEELAAEPFVRGIHADLTTQLSMMSALKVISRTSVERLNDAGRPVPEIARELGASWVLAGGVQTAGDSVRVTAQLLDARSDAQVWAERYDRRLTVENIFGIQADLAQNIADAMEAEISPEEQGRLGRPPTADLEAYNLYRMGRNLADRRSTESLSQAADYFREAIALDSSYAQAYVGLADVHTQLGTWGVMSRREAFRTAREAAQRALSLDDVLGSAWTSLGYIRYWYDWDWGAAEQAFRRAIELNPGYSTAHHWYSLLLATLGRFDEAETAIGRAVERDPLSRIIRTIEARLRWLRGDAEGAVTGHRRALELDPSYAVGHMWLALAYENQGMIDEARRHYRRATTLDPDGPVPLAGLAHAHAISGERQEARELLRELRRRGEGESPVPFWSAVVHADLGEIDRAFEQLDLALRVRDGWVTELAVTPLLAPLRSDPRYHELAGQLGLGEAGAAATR